MVWGSFLTLLHRSTLPCTFYAATLQNSGILSPAALAPLGLCPETLASLVALDSQLLSPQLRESACRAPPGFPTLGCGLETRSRRRAGVVSSLTAFVFRLSGIMLLCCLIPSVLKNCFISFVWILSCFKQGSGSSLCCFILVESGLSLQCL